MAAESAISPTAGFIFLATTMLLAFPLIITSKIA